MIYYYYIIIVLILWVIKQQWKRRKTLMLSRKLRTKYLALPIVGHAYMFLGTGEDRMNTFKKFGREAIKSEHGVVSLWLGSQYYSYICDPIVAETISKASLGKTELTKMARDLLGNGLNVSPVHIWRPRRKILAPTFSQKNLNSFMATFTEQSMVMTSCLKSRVGSGKFSIWNDITRYSMDSVCQTVLGVKMNAQTQTFHPFLEAYDKYFETLASRLVQPWLHWDFLYKLMPVYQEVEKCTKIIHDFVDNIVRKKKIIVKNDYNMKCNTDDVRVTTFLDLLLTSPGGSKYTDVETREELLVLILAGTDTSAVGISFVIVMLSRYMSVQEKAYDEIRLILGGSKRSITLEDLPRLKYTEALIKETLRLYPPVPIIIRENDRDVKLNSDITLPAGSCNAIYIWGIHRNPKYWGADAEEFNPNRFLNGSVTPAAAFMPFSYGPRNCIGYKYAMMSMKVTVATLLRDYKVLPPTDMAAEELRKPLRLKFDIMMKDVDNFNVRLEQRY